MDRHQWSWGAQRSCSLRLQHGQRFDPHGCDSRVPRVRRSWLQSSESTRLAEGHQSARWVLLPDAQPQSTDGYTWIFQRSKYPSRVAQLDRLQFLMIYSARTIWTVGVTHALYGYAITYNCSHRAGNESGAQPCRPESFKPVCLRATVMPCPLAAMLLSEIFLSLRFGRWLLAGSQHKCLVDRADAPKDW